MESKKEDVTALLKKNSEGLTLIEISKMLSISRNAVAIVIAELKGAEKIRIREIGKAKLIYWGEKK